MGCISSQQKSIKEVQSVRSVKSYAQLEYELNNCYDHFQSISITLQKSQKFIFKSVGKELTNKEYCLHYSKIESQSSQSQLIESFDIFFKSVEQGLQLLPMILKQCIKLEASLKDKKEEITDFKQQITSYIDFCKSIELPQHLNSQSTEH